ncbi:MAG TPA: alcohol dehydrogenase catalytic domain-containing protein [Dissulfurispiraceae bacterium]|nr:alcohol dehydrogenase catalytic domain-containing protein [Dissulfurispiraceae bacterium]
MKVAKLYSITDIRIEDAPMPHIGPHDALMRTRACGICSGDVMPWYIEKKAPLVIGHEPAGELVAVGSEVRSFAPGDRVFVHHHAPCTVCRCCQRGDHVQCETWRISKIIPGGISEYVLIPEVNLRHDTLKLPDSVSYDDGSLVEPAACVVKSLKRSGIRKGDTVLILGLGVMGQMHVLLAREFGAGCILGVDMVDYRLLKAIEFGADEVINVLEVDMNRRISALTGGRMADIVIVGPNSAEVMLQGMDSVAAGGTVVLFTPAKPGESLTVDPNKLYFRDISIVTSYSCGPEDTRNALGLIQKGIISAEKLVTHRFSIEQTADAYQLAGGAGDSLKSLIAFP